MRGERSDKGGKEEAGGMERQRRRGEGNVLNR